MGIGSGDSHQYLTTDFREGHYRSFRQGRITSSHRVEWMLLLSKLILSFPTLSKFAPMSPSKILGWYFFLNQCLSLDIKDPMSL